MSFLTVETSSKLQFGKVEMNQAEQLQDQYVKVGSVNTRYWQAGDSGSTVIIM